MISKRLPNLALGASVLACFIGVQVAQGTITHTGTDVDAAVAGLADFQALGYGHGGYYFPQFDAGSAVTQRPTWENMAFSVPGWISFQFDITQPDRTFSGDAGFFSGDVNDPMDEVAPFGDPLVVGVYSEGGDTAWDSFKLPDGTTGLSGSVVDEHADNNSNNSVNRIQLGAGTPSSFFLRIVVDNTNGEHDPVGRLRARGEGPGGLDEDVQLNNITVNQETDIYTFRYEGYEDGDFIKIQLNSGVEGEDPGFGGLMFDVVGDVSGDGLVNNQDVEPFLQLLLNGPYRDVADMNGDGGLDGLDVDPFVALVSSSSGGSVGAVPEPSTAALALAAMIGLAGVWRHRRRCRNSSAV